MKVTWHNDYDITLEEDIDIGAVVTVETSSGRPLVIESLALRRNSKDDTWEPSYKTSLGWIPGGEVVIQNEDHAEDIHDQFCYLYGYADGLLDREQPQKGARTCHNLEIIVRDKR